MPCTDVSPSEITLHHRLVLHLFQYRHVEREIEKAGEIMIALGIEDALQMVFQFVEASHIDAGVPQPFTTIDKHTGKLTVGFLRK